MADVLAFYWNPSTTPQHHLYGLAPATLAGEPEAREDGLPSMMMLVAAESFVASWLPYASAENAAWQGIAPGMASIEGQDDLPAIWFPDQGLFRFQADEQTLHVLLLGKPNRWFLRHLDSEEQGRAFIVDGTLVPWDMLFGYYPGDLFELVP